MNKTILVTCLLYLIVSCNTEESHEKKSVDLDTQTEEKNDDPKNEVVYSIPSPNEQYDLLYFLGGNIDATYVNDLSRVSNYTTTKQKALNFGVYMSDAAYMMKFNQGKKVFLDYVSTLDELGRSLDVSQVYGEDLLEKVEEIGADSEKLFELSSDNYLKVFDKMLENDKGKELSLMLSGAWIETMHILFKSAGDFEADFEIQEAIADQRFVLDNLIGFVSKYNEDEDVRETLEKLNKIKDLFGNLDCTQASVEVKEQGDNSFVLDGGDSCLFTQQTYSSMKSLINDIRDSIIL
jgi:Lhr-like helicase